jgi:hypothetical protein
VDAQPNNNARWLHLWFCMPARGKIVFSPPHLLSASVERTATPLRGGPRFVAGYGAPRSWSLLCLSMGREGSGCSWPPPTPAPSSLPFSSPRNPSRHRGLSPSTVASSDRAAVRMASRGGGQLLWEKSKKRRTASRR